MAYNSFSELTEKIANGFGYEVEFNPTWYEEYKNDELTIFQTLSVLRAQRLTDEELFYYQRMQYLRYIPHYKKEVLANRSQFNITDTLIKVTNGGFLKIGKSIWFIISYHLPIGKLPANLMDSILESLYNA